MMKLYKTNEGHAELLLTQLELAESFWQRGKGLLGHSKLEFDQALWIKPCNNIHTMFMRFSIDCIFLDKKLVVQKIVNQVKPFRLIGPCWKSYSVIETTAGFAERKKIKVGDHLYVVS